VFRGHVYNLVLIFINLSLITINPYLYIDL